MATTLECVDCGKSKPVEEFSRDRRNKAREGRDRRCRLCKSAHQKSPAHRAATRRANIKRRFGMTVEEYEQLVGQGCSLCDKPARRVVLDHCHSTGRVRGPLCDSCNIMLGWLENNADWVQRALEYAKT